MWTKLLRTGALTLAATVGVALTASLTGAGSPTPTRSLVAASADLPAPTNTGPVTGTGTGSRPNLVNVRTGRHDAYDRTVFDFVGGTPGYRVEYGTLVSGGTGEPIPLAGRADLVVVFNPAYAHDVDTGTVTF